MPGITRTSETKEGAEDKTESSVFSDLGGWE